MPKAGKGGKGLLSLLGALDGGKDLNNGNDIGSVAENTKSKDLTTRSVITINQKGIYRV